MEYLASNVPAWSLPIIEAIAADIEPYFTDYGQPPATARASPATQPFARQPSQPPTALARRLLALPGGSRGLARAQGRR